MFLQVVHCAADFAKRFPTQLNYNYIRQHGAPSDIWMTIDTRFKQCSAQTISTILISWFLP